MPPVGFKPTIWAGERPQTYALDCATTGTGCVLTWMRILALNVTCYHKGASVCLHAELSLMLEDLHLITSPDTGYIHTFPCLSQSLHKKTGTLS